MNKQEAKEKIIIMLEQYLKKISKKCQSGDATEESYYPILIELFEKFFESKQIKKGDITSIPKAKEGNKPDFVVRIGKELIGYIEAKDFSKVKTLDSVETTEQILRYKKEFDNFILTNFLEFWLWRKSENRWIKQVKIAQPNIIKKFENIPPPQDSEKCLELFEDFIKFSIPEKKSAKQLAIELAVRAKRIREPIVEELENEIDTEVDQIYRAFKKYLITDLSEVDFADIYAQTITYGLFIARLQYHGEKKNFNRTLARKLIPKSLKIIKDTFSFISREDLPVNINWIIDDIATVLAYADMEKIRNELHRRTAGDDPLMHFYETFLAEYDPKKREKLGVYYTPLPVVSYITRSINILLKEKFGKELGFASKGVTLLDFASGTCTFPAQAILETKKEIDDSSRPGNWLSVVKEHILKNYFAFEILMAPYIIGHLKISLLLQDLEYKFENGEKFNLFLTNTLDFTNIEQQEMPIISDLSEEARNAGKVKKDIPILIITGNPPYSVSSSNKTDFIEREMALYKEEVRSERNIQPLSDDYIKFIRFAHWKIEQLGQGIIGIITNNSYLDGLIHRGMRHKLLESFDEIYILNLHGNLRRNETAPDGGKDENVFDIQQGVAITFFVKLENKSEEVKIKYYDLYGLRGQKYEFLNKSDIKKTKWQKLEIKAPNYFFVPKDFGLGESYKKFISVKSVFSYSTSGVKTHHDNFILSHSKEELEQRLLLLTNKNIDNDIIKTTFKLKEGKDFKLDIIRDKFFKNGLDYSLFSRYSYRPFLNLWTYYNEQLIERARGHEIWDIKDNFFLITTRQLSTSLFRHSFITNFTPDICLISLQTKESAYAFPLYLDQKINNDKIFSGQKILDLKNTQKQLDETPGKTSNIKREIFDLLKQTYKKSIAPEEVFFYIYGVLYSNKYRSRYNEFLKIDFTRVPFTADYQLFKKFADFGKH